MQCLQLIPHFLSLDSEENMVIDTAQTSLCWIASSFSFVSLSTIDFGSSDDDEEERLALLLLLL